MSTRRQGGRSEPDPASARRRVECALSWREALFGAFGREPHTSAYRLLNSEGDGFPGIVVDAYAGFLIVQVAEPSRLAQAAELEEILQQTLRPRGIVRKLRYARPQRGRVEQEVARGEAPPTALRVLEEDLPLEVDLLGGMHTGLFTDMRQERLRLRRLSKGRTVLNTFAYTGAFSVAAAAGGAAQVTSVDVVAGALERARRNFLAAGLDPQAHRFACMEVLEYLKMAARRGWRFGAVVLDPPTFATFRSGRWSARAGYPALLARALPLVESGGLLWVAANTESITDAQMERIISEAVRRAGCGARLVALGGLPPDYPTPLHRPASRYLKVHVLQVD